MLPDIFVGLAGLLLVSLPLPMRKQGPWLVVPLSLRPRLVVGCFIVLLPCAFGMVALNLARLIILHGGVLAALVIYRSLPSFCLLGIVVTNQVCDIDAGHGWLVHVQETLWSLVHP